jgi:hypothetical protein
MSEKRLEAVDELSGKKPKLLLHIGHSKTGTTALQQYLAGHAQELLSHGYLYPTRGSVRVNHLTLPAGFVTPEYNSYHRQIYHNDFSAYQRDFRRFWELLGNDIRRYSPHTVIISAEQLFRDFSDISRLPLSELLGQYFSDVQVIAYIRSPAPDYLSNIAQQIRAGFRVIPPRLRKIRRTIEYYQLQFPGCVALHPFDRQQLVGGDIVQDFISRYIPPAVSMLEVKKAGSANTSLPWPLLVGLEQIRRRAQPDLEAPSLATRARIYMAIKFYAWSPARKLESRVRLRPEVEDFIRRSAVEHLWLKQQFGIVFADLDYSVIESMTSPYTADVALEQLVDISTTPRDAVPVERYLGNGPLFWLGYPFFALRLWYARVYRVFLQG